MTYDQELLDGLSVQFGTKELILTGDYGQREIPITELVQAAIEWEYESTEDERRDLLHLSDVLRQAANKLVMHVTAMAEVGR
jgi:hypothetical protein